MVQRVISTLQGPWGLYQVGKSWSDRCEVKRCLCWVELVILGCDKLNLLVAYVLSIIKRNVRWLIPKDTDTFGESPKKQKIKPHVEGFCEQAPWLAVPEAASPTRSVRWLWGKFLILYFSKWHLLFMPELESFSLSSSQLLLNSEYNLQSGKVAVTLAEISSSGYYCSRLPIGFHSLVSPNYLVCSQSL